MVKKVRLSRTSINVIFACVFLLAVNAVLGFLLMNQSRQSLKTLIYNRMLDISNTAADMLDGDVLEDIRAEDADTPGYRAVLRTLTYFQDNIDLEYIYCIRDLGGGNFVFTVDPTVEDPGEFGSPIVYTDALYRASLGTASVDSEPYEDDWGRFYSAYSPVFDSRGRVAGIVAVDFSADWFDRQIRREMVITLIMIVVSLGVGAVIVALVTSRTRKRYRMIYNELNGVSEGIELLVRETTASSGAESLHTEASKEKRPMERSGDEIVAIGKKIRSLQTTLSEQISFVRSRVYIDGLTGLENRTAYLEEIDRLDRQIREGTAAFAVAVFDLNGLKGINDGLGHEKGDRAITEAGAILKSTFGADGRLYRIGGDEYIAILRKTEPEMKALFEEFDRSLARRNAGDPELAVEMSKGCAVFDREKDGEFRSVFNRADDAMYNDKAAYYKTHADRRRR